MAPISAFFDLSMDAPRQILDAIDAQFQLDDEKLHAIVNQFLDDFRLGLSEYNHPMAMMYVGTRSARGNRTDLFKTDLRHWRTERIRNRVSYRSTASPTLSCELSEITARTSLTLDIR